MKTRSVLIIIIFYLVIYGLLLLYQIGIGNPFGEDVPPVLTLFMFWLFGVLALIAVLKERKKLLEINKKGRNRIAD